MDTNPWHSCTVARGKLTIVAPHLPLVIEARGAGAAGCGITAVQQYTGALLDDLILPQSDLLVLATWVLHSRRGATIGAISVMR